MRLSQLREIREAQALSLRALSRLSRVTPTTIMRAEKGEPVYPTTVRKLATALGVTPAELRGDTPAAPAPVPIGERQAVMVANALGQAERARARGDEAGAAMFEQLAAEAATAQA